MDELIFLKLGGSLITDKTSPRTPREDLIKSACQEIKEFLSGHPGSKLLLGHGSGSFGHFSGTKHKTREGVKTARDWQGFSEVGRDAADLNHLVMKNLSKTGLGAFSFPPSGSARTSDRKIINWDLSPIQTALDNHLLPVVYGDVVFDNLLGGTILSTEELFFHLARELNPSRILLAGVDQGVWSDYPQRKKLIKSITPETSESVLSQIDGSGAPDVTGGMAAKVDLMLELIALLPNLSVQIFSGTEKGSVFGALEGEILGTIINKK